MTSNTENRSQDIIARLKEIDIERNALLKELAGLRKAGDKPSVEIPLRGLSASLTPLTSSEKRLALFQRLFCCRTDVFPKLWQNSKTGSKGYSPACKNEWVRGVTTECSQLFFWKFFHNLQYHIAGCFAWEKWQPIWFTWLSHPPCRFGKWRYMGYHDGMLIRWQWILDIFSSGIYFSCNFRECTSLLSAYREVISSIFRRTLSNSSVKTPVGQSGVRALLLKAILRQARQRANDTTYSIPIFYRDWYTLPYRAERTGNILT